MKKLLIVGLIGIGLLMSLGLMEHRYTGTQCRIREVGNGYVVAIDEDTDRQYFIQTNKQYVLNEKVKLILNDNNTINNTNDDYIIGLKKVR